MSKEAKAKNVGLFRSGGWENGDAGVFGRASVWKYYLLGLMSYVVRDVVLLREVVGVRWDVRQRLVTGDHEVQPWWGLCALCADVRFFQVQANS